MKTVELSRATDSLASYAANVKTEPVLVTRRGKPVAAVISMIGMDRESLSLSTNPKFVAIIEKSRASRKQGTISSDEMRRRLGLTRRAGGKTAPR
jgi:PHD/YefM family antitoxin component YafN of YafNO toxin-antitoxin module